MADNSPSPAPVTTTTGNVSGVADRGVISFKGMPYGEDTGGQNRFLPPRPKTPWPDTLHADHYGADGIQARGPKPKAGATTNNFDLPVSEDCLCLNVWTKATDNRRRPVMVWLHGGGFYSGSASGSMYDGHNLVSRGDVVLVSINHRLGAFGFLHLAYVDETADESVNVGMLDIVLALKWVRDNVAAFGGDPDNVTVFGESGGGRKVTTLLAMPAARGLFHKGVIESGPAVFMNTVDGVTRLAEALLEELGIHGNVLDELQRMPAEVLLEAQKSVIAKFGRNTEGLAQVFAPVVDGTSLPHQPFHPEAPAISDGVPLIVGYNETEWTLFMGRDPDLLDLDHLRLLQRLKAADIANPETVVDVYQARYPSASAADLLALILTGNSRYPIDSLVLAERKAMRGAAPVFFYTLTFRTPAGKGSLRTPHALEIPFVFDNVETSVRFVGDGDAPRQLANQMSEAWLAFAHSGNPNHEGIPFWPTYDTQTRSTMVFNETSEVHPDYGRTERAVWQQVFYGN